MSGLGALELHGAAVAMFGLVVCMEFFVSDLALDMIGAKVGGELHFPGEVKLVVLVVA